MNAVSFQVLDDEARSKLVEDVAKAVAAIIAGQTTQSPLLVDSDRMAAMLSISRPHLDRLKAAGTIPSIGVGRSRRYCPADVVAALASQNEKGVPA
jgi:hypothetical protein